MLIDCYKYKSKNDGMGKSSAIYTLPWPNSRCFIQRSEKAFRSTIASLIKNKLCVVFAAFEKRMHMQLDFRRAIKDANHLTSSIHVANNHRKLIL